VDPENASAREFLLRLNLSTKTVGVVGIGDAGKPGSNGDQRTFRSSVENPDLRSLVLDDVDETLRNFCPQCMDGLTNQIIPNLPNHRFATWLWVMDFNATLHNRPNTLHYVQFRAARGRGVNNSTPRW
jgi:hypothetical protein